MIGCIGLALGLGTAAASGRIIESRLFGVSRLDPVVVGATAISMLALTVIASVVPALRAARVDPVQSLRVE